MNQPLNNLDSTAQNLAQQRKVTIILPGLLDSAAVPGDALAPAGNSFSDESTPESEKSVLRDADRSVSESEFPALLKLLNHSRLSVSEVVDRSICYEHALFKSFSPETGRGLGELPIAHCSYLADFNETAPTHCVRADPVHIRMESDHGQLLPPDVLDLETEHSDALLVALNQHFNDDGIRFDAGRRNRWYVTGKPSSGLDTAPVSYVSGRNIAMFLPRSDEQSEWRQLANEIHMLLHDHPVNIEREAAGLPAVNALWFWGGAPVPTLTGNQGIRLYSDAAFAVGLARLAGVTAFPLDEAPHFLSQAISQPANLLQAGSQPKTSSTVSVIPNTSAEGTQLQDTSVQNNQSKETHPEVISHRTHTLIVDTRLLEAVLVGDTEKRQRRVAELDDAFFKVSTDLLLNGAIDTLVIDSADQKRWEISMKPKQGFYAITLQGSKLILGLAKKCWPFRQ